MTPDELEKLLRNESPPRCTDALVEAIRQGNSSLAKATVAIKRKAKAELAARVAAHPHSWWNDNTAKKMWEFEARVQLAILAFCPWTEAQRVSSVIRGTFHRVDFKTHILRILKVRKPDWLERWVNKEIDARDQLSANVNWLLLRELIRDGLCPVPKSDSYVAKMVYGIFAERQNTSLRDLLLADPALLDHEIWRLFEIVPGRETVLHVGDITWAPPPGHPSHSWARTLADLAAEGRIDRQRLLSASLDGLLRNTVARHTGWFQKFHELLVPSDDERVTLQPSYFQLLGHPVPAVVGMALGSLGALDKAKRLDRDGFLAAVGAVFHLAPKAQPLAALRILSRMKGDVHVQPRLAEVLIAALAHPLPQVQEPILRLLENLATVSAETIAAQLPERLDQLAPSLQPDARKLLGELPADITPAEPDTNHETFDAALEAAQRIPEPWRTLAGIGAILNDHEGTTPLTAVSCDLLAVPRLYDDQRVQPVESLDQLIERLTVAIERLDDAIEFELLIDGLSRTCGERPDDFEAQTAPLLARIAALRYVNGVPPIYQGGLKSAICGLVLKWCGKDVTITRDERDSIFGFLDTRLAILALRFRDRQPAPLLACPTHRQGWIEAAALAERLRTYDRLGIEPTKTDFIQAILRLAPDDRAKVLATSADLRGKFAVSLRFALGGPLEETKDSPEVLIAAGRARSPLGDIGELTSQPGVGAPDAARAARYDWHVVEPRSKTNHRWPRVSIATTPDSPTPDKVRDVPTSLMHPWRNKADFAWDGQLGLNRWKATVWPANLDSYFVIGVRIYPGPYSQVTLLKQRATFLEPLFDQNVPLSEMARLLLAMCLNEQSPEVTGLAVDVLAETIRDGRCTGPEIGDVLGRLMVGNYLILSRVGKHLETVGRCSALHSHVCAEIVQTAFASVAQLPKDAHSLLAPLLEWLALLEQGLHRTLRPLLEGASSGKTGSLARKLLALPSSPVQRGKILVDALQGRVARAERWMSAHV